MVISTKTVCERINGDIQGYVNGCEQCYTRKITELADALCESKDFKPIILLSGPSGSGKTTTALRIENLLDRRGFETHTVSMDNYFNTVSQKQQEQLTPIDYESPQRLDAELLKSHLKALAECEPVKIPKFKFKTKSRSEDEFTFLQRKPDEFVIIEGIHALNPEITGGCESFANIVYASARTRFETSSGEIVHPSAIRLARRILRDKFFRAKTVLSTIKSYDSVEKGEKLYILPYKYRSDFDIDTVIPYEICVYRDLILPELYELSDIPVCRALISLLEDVKPIEEKYIPDNSLLREFIGGSSLKY